VCDESGLTKEIWSFATILPSFCRIGWELITGAFSAFTTHTVFMRRHYMGDLRQVSFTNYAATAKRLYRGVRALRRAYED
jgi:hypothetical protein